MAEAVGGALVFFSFLIALVIVGAYVVAYAAHCLLVIVQGTASGSDEIVWPDDMLLDWIRGSGGLAGILALCLVPAGFVSRGLATVWLPHEPLSRFLSLAVPMLWLIFPFGLLSVLSANSPWVLFRPVVVLQLVRFAPAVVIFYFVSALLIVGAIAPWYGALVAGWFWLLPVAVGVGSAALFIYARLLGRLAWLLNRVEIPKARAAATPVRKVARRRRGTDVTDPWAVPEEVTFDPPVNLPVDGYDLAAPGTQPEDAPREGKRQRRVKGYTLRSEELPPTPAQSTTVGDHVLQRHLAERTHASYAPPRPFWTGVYSFPWYPGSVAPWLWLTLGGVGSLALTLAMGVFRPL